MGKAGLVRALNLSFLALLLCAATNTQAARLDADVTGAVAPKTDV